MKPTKTEPVKNISELRVGDIIASKISHFPMFVVGVFAESGTLGFDAEDYTGTVYADFPDNEGDVFEFNLKEIEKVVKYDY